MIVMCLINVIMSIPPNKISYDRVNVLGSVKMTEATYYIVDFSVAAAQHKYVGDYSNVIVDKPFCREL